MRPDQKRKQMNVNDAELQRCVAEYSTGRFKMNPFEVSRCWGGSASAKKRKVRNRKLDVRSSRIQLTHRPTGITVDACVPAGHYSKKEMRRLCQERADAYMPILEHMVIRYLKTLAMRQFGPPPKDQK